MSDKHVSSPSLPNSASALAIDVEDNESISSSPTATESPYLDRIFDKSLPKAKSDGDTDSETDSLLGIPTSPTRGASPLVFEDEQRPPAKKQTATWSSLPRKGQLALLTLSRLSEPLTQTSLQSYMFYQLKNFDPSLPDATIAAQAGMLQAAFTATQFITAIAWGRAADSDKIGRKVVLMIGLFGTMISALGFGFSKTFISAMIFRSLGGALNGNVGVMRTMISEIIKERRFQSRAFMVLPMTFNVGVIIGPILGGILSDPINSYPQVFGPNTFFGGKDGVWWMREYPYALPNLVSAMFLLASSLSIFLGLDETHEILRTRPDRGRQLGKWIWTRLLRRKLEPVYTSIPTQDFDSSRELQSPFATATKSHVPPPPPKPRRKLPIRRIWTRNVLVTLGAHGMMAMHIGTFNNLWFLFLSTPRFDKRHPDPAWHTEQRLPFSFTGGLGMPPARIGMALSILGIIGIFVQLGLYPKLSAHLGTERSYRVFGALFPVAYVLAPYLCLLPSSTLPPLPANGIIIWAGITFVLAIQVTARTFALPAMTILVNNCCPHPSVLGTIHGIAQSYSSFMRTIGPAFSGWMYGKGLTWAVVGTAFFILSCVACLGSFASCFVKEGNGHEILLDGEEEELDGRR